MAHHNVLQYHCGSRARQNHNHFKIGGMIQIFHSGRAGIRCPGGVCVHVWSERLWYR